LYRSACAGLPTRAFCHLIGVFERRLHLKQYQSFQQYSNISSKGGASWGEFDPGSAACNEVNDSS
jgi:hypothetical protein